VPCETTKQEVTLSVHQDGGRPRTGIPEILETEAIIAKIEFHAIMSKYPEADFVVQQVHKVVNDIEILAKCTPAKEGESSWWTTIVNSAEENRAKFCTFLDGKPLFSALYGMYMVTLKELKVNAQAGQNGAMNKTSLESTVLDDNLQEVKRRKRHISTDTSQTAKK
jgi:hypothetical protein